jgi:DNA-binding transcriptional LysR family regulator
MSAAPDVSLLSLFVAVAETGSFSKAAQQLGVTKGTVSRALARLESQLDAELVQRTTRFVGLTSAGAALYEKSAPHLMALRAAVSTLPDRQEQPAGRLKLTTLPDFAAMVLADVLARYASRYPAVAIELVVTGRQVDVVAEGFDVAIRAAGKLRDSSSLTMRRLGVIQGGFYAAPSYVARRGMPRTVGEEGHDWLLFPPLLRRLGLPAGCRPRILADDMFFLREAARAGAGCTILSALLADPYVERGELVRVVPGFRPWGSAFVMLYRRKPPARTRAFVEMLVDSLKRTAPLRPA